MCTDTELCSKAVDALNEYHKLAGKLQKLAKAEIPRLQDTQQAASRGNKQHIVDAYIADTIEAIQQLADYAKYMTKKH